MKSYKIVVKKEHVEKYLELDREARSGRINRSICCRCPVFLATKEVIPWVESVGFTCATVGTMKYLDASKETISLMDNLTTMFTNISQNIEELLANWTDKIIELVERD